jgi:hypothetical protein
VPIDAIEQCRVTEVSEREYEKGKSGGRHEIDHRSHYRRRLIVR